MGGGRIAPIILEIGTRWWSASRSGRFTLRKEPPLQIVQEAKCVPDPDGMLWSKDNSLTSARNWTSAVQPAARCYTDWTKRKMLFEAPQAQSIQLGSFQEIKIQSKMILLLKVPYFTWHCLRFMYCTVLNGRMFVPLRDMTPKCLVFWLEFRMYFSYPQCTLNVPYTHHS
jgi:hypothetical protein